MSGNRLMRSCPKCLAETRWVGADVVLKLFWERLPGFFICPLDAGTMIYMAVLSLGVLLQWFMPYLPDRQADGKDTARRPHDPSGSEAQQGTPGQPPTWAM